jgi:carbon monoxide dehydrogenase subunit G
MSRFTGQRFVAAPPSDVYALISDPAALARTRPTARVLADERMPDGTRQVSLETRLSSGSTLTSTIVVLDTTENERVVSHTAAGPFGSGLTSFGQLNTDRIVTLEPHPDGTLVTTEINWRFKPAWLDLFLRLLYRRKLRESAEAGTRALQAHFEIAEETELEVAYEWTQADARAINRWSLRRSPRIRLGILACLVSLALAASVEQAFGLLTLLIAPSLLFTFVRALIRRRPLRSESRVVLSIGPVGARFTTTEGESDKALTLAWADLKAIRQLRHYLVFVSGQPGIAGQFVPKRAFDSMPNGLARLQQIAARGGMGGE